MKTWNPIIISIVIAILLQVSIVPWAQWNGTLNWQTCPLYLIFTIPAGAIVIVIGVFVSLAKLTMKKNPTPTTEKRTLTLKEGFWLHSSSKVRRHTILGENPASTKQLNMEKDHSLVSEASQAELST